MNRPFLLPPLSAEELLELQRLLRAQKTPAGLYRRCNLVWQLAAGFNLGEASEIAGLHYTNAHEWIKRFQRSGISGLSNLPRPGRPKLYGKKPETLVIQTATSRPPDLGLGFTTWSLAKLEEHLRRHAGLKSLSRETIRRILMHHGLRFLTGQTWCQSEDPEFDVKKRHHRSLSSSSEKRGCRLF
jgi:transposase